MSRPELVVIDERARNNGYIQRVVNAGDRIVVGGINPPVVDPYLLQKAQNWNCSLDHVDIDQHHNEFGAHLQQEADLWNKRLQSMVSGAYTQIDFGADYANGRTQLNGLFSAVETEEKIINQEHREVVAKNNTLIAKSQELAAYNSKLWKRIEDQQFKLSQVGALKDKLRMLEIQAENAGMVETVEEQAEHIGNAHETGKLVANIFVKVGENMKRSFSGDRGLQERVVVSGGATQNQVVEKLVQGQHLENRFVERMQVSGGAVNNQFAEKFVQGGNQFGNRFGERMVVGGGATNDQYAADKFVQGVNQIRTQNQVVEKFVRASNHGDSITSSDQYGTQKFLLETNSTLPDGHKTFHIPRFVEEGVASSSGAFNQERVVSSSGAFDLVGQPLTKI